MRFDDRLSTVLRKPVSGKAIARIQYRQLLDLLGTTATESRQPLVDAAFLRLAQLSERIPASERARILEDPVLRLRNPRLVAELAVAEPTVATAAIAAARLGEEQWLDLIPALPIAARGVVRYRRDLGPRVERLLQRLGVVGRGLPPGQVQAAPAEEPIQEIGAIVRRIEQFRKTRQQHDELASSDAPLLLLGGESEPTQPLFPALESVDFATNSEGRIVWSDSAAAPMAVGLLLAAADAHAPVQAGSALIEAFARRQPVTAARIRIAGAPAIEGDWQVDAAPRFEHPGGRFVGYCGRLRRLPAKAPSAGAHPAPDNENDRMRQILHELRTPVNAIQGFAEVIQQQLFGPTPHEYRALAASIASDSARMLAGFEELDRLVKLDAGAMALDKGECDLVSVVAMTLAQLESYLAARAGGFLFDPPESAIPLGLTQPEAERIFWRLLATLASWAAPGEVLKLKIRPPRDGFVRMIARLPDALAHHSDEELFHATAGAGQQALSAGMFGTGFALRLAVAEARAAGGGLERREGKMRLTLPVNPILSVDRASSLDDTSVHQEMNRP